MDCRHHKIGWKDEALNEVGDGSRNKTSSTKKPVKGIKASNEGPHQQGYKPKENEPRGRMSFHERTLAYTRIKKKVKKWF